MGAGKTRVRGRAVPSMSTSTTVQGEHSVTKGIVGLEFEWPVSIREMPALDQAGKAGERWGEGKWGGSSTTSRVEERPRRRRWMEQRRAS